MPVCYTGLGKSYRTPFESCPCMRPVHCEPPLSKQAFRMQKHWAHTQLLSAHPRSQGGILFRLPTPKGDTLRLRVRVLFLKCCFSAPCLCPLSLQPSGQTVPLRVEECICPLNLRLGTEGRLFVCRLSQNESVSVSPSARCHLCRLNLRVKMCAILFPFFPLFSPATYLGTRARKMNQRQ